MLVRSFIEEGSGQSEFPGHARTRGGLHRVDVYDDINQLPNKPYQDTNFIRVDCCPSDSNGYFAVRYSRAGFWIQACGSGNLAAMYCLSLQGYDVRFLTSKLETMACLCKDKGEENDKVKNETGLLGYAVSAARFRALESSDSPNSMVISQKTAVDNGPTDLADAPSGFDSGTDTIDTTLLNKDIPPVSLWFVNDSNYLLCVYESANSISTMQPDFEKLKNATQSAIIVTAKNKSELACDYVMRYFAPQYGTDEDDATGSANAIVGQYWQWILNSTCVTGRQLSKLGASITVERANDSPPDSLNTASKMHVFGKVKLC